MPLNAWREQDGMDYLIFGLFLVGWILLQHVLLPKLGVPT
jgi:hypothetical protein